MVTIDPTVDFAQQMLPLFEGDAALQDPGVASFVEFALHKNKGLGMMCEPSGLHPIYRQCVTEELVEVEHSPVNQRVRLCCWILFELHDLRARRSCQLVCP